MSRPAAPSWSIAQFAPDTNYAAGSDPWSGTQTKVAHAGASSVGITPRTAVSAQVANYYWNKTFSHDQSAKDLLTDLVDYTGQIPALNWSADTPLTAASLIRGAVCTGGRTTDGKVYLFGDDAQVYTVSNWEPATEDDISTDLPSTASESLISGAVDDSGNIVLSSDSRYLWEFDGASWSRVDVVGGAHTAHGVVAYDPVNARWIHATAAASKVKTSTDRTTWTAAATQPATFSGGAHCLDVNTSNGVALLGDFSGDGAGGAADVSTMYKSTDGGQNWTSLTAPAATFDGESAALTYNAADNSWLYVLANYSSPKSQVWRSTNDGTSWSLVCTLSDYALGRPAYIGKLWCATASSSTNEIVYSVDDGATWHRSLVDLGGGAMVPGAGMFTDGNGFAKGQGVTAILSLRVGLSTGSVLT